MNLHVEVNVVDPLGRQIVGWAVSAGGNPALVIQANGRRVVVELTCDEANEVAIAGLITSRQIRDAMGAPAPAANRIVGTDGLPLNPQKGAV